MKNHKLICLEISLKILLNLDRITWDEFCTFMQLNFSDKEEKVKRFKEVNFVTPARTESNPHRNSIQKISANTDGNYNVMSLDGIFSIWSPVGELKRIRKEIVEAFLLHSFHLRYHFQGFYLLLKIDKRAVIKDKGDKGGDSKRTRAKWITDFEILTECNKLVLGTGLALFLC
jgi:hypothetical protein